MRFVLKTIPRHMSTDISIDTAIHIDFLVDLDVQKLDDQKIFLFDLTEEKEVPIDFTYRNKHLTITPKELLKPNNHYQIELLGGPDGIVDIIGRYQEKTYISEFYTKDVKQIKSPTLLMPSHLSEINQPVTFKWEPVEQAAYYKLQVSKSRSFNLLEWPKEEMPIYQTEITPDLTYEQGHYFARICAIDWEGVQSDFSDPIQFYISNVSAKQNMSSGSESSLETPIIIQSQTRVIDEQPMQVLEINDLQVTNSQPKDQAFNVPVSQVSSITLTFSEPIDPNSINSNTCYLIEEKT